jgi:hypothetical protein
VNKKRTFLWASLALGPVPAMIPTVFWSEAAQAETRDQAFNAFAASGYSYCDAVVLASRWNQQPLDVKVTIGRKIDSGGAAVVKSELAAARAAAMKDPSKGCRFWDAGFQYSDAEKLAKIWKTSVDSAKTMVEQKLLTDGGEGRLHALLAQAPVATKPAPAKPPQPSQNQDMTAFFASSYTYCDAKVLSSHWASSVDDAKALIGRKIGWGNADIVKSELQSARAEAQKDPKRACTFWDAGFQYSDAEKLAKIWKTSVDAAKATVQQKILTDGGENRVRALLGQPIKQAAAANKPAAPPDQDLQSFFGTGYGYCDAKVLSAHWSTSVEDAKATVGRKIGYGNGAFVTSELRLARAEATKDPSRGCTFWDAGYEYADAEKLAKAWKTSVGDAKAMVEKKLLVDGGQARIDALLRAK